VYVESAKSRQVRRARRATKVLEFAPPQPGRRIVPHLTLDPPQPEEAGWVSRYLELADRALNNHDLPNPAARPLVTGASAGVAVGGPTRRRAG